MGLGAPRRVRSWRSRSARRAMAAKVDLKRELQDLYTAKSAPAMVEVPEQQFLMIDGHGDPNTSKQYREAVSALFSVSYAAKFALKRAGIVDYVVMPLEGLWSSADMSAFTTGDKSAWDWTMMIMQPDSVTLEVFEAGVGEGPRRSRCRRLNARAWSDSPRDRLHRSCIGVHTARRGRRSPRSTPSSRSRATNSRAGTTRSISATPGALPRRT